MTFTILLHLIWHTLLGFIFYYPLFMSSLWIVGAIFFYYKNEKPYLTHTIPELRPNESWPGVSILIPCYNEGENAIE